MKIFVTTVGLMVLAPTISSAQEFTCNGYILRVNNSEISTISKEGYLHSPIISSRQTGAGREIKVRGPRGLVMITLSNPMSISWTNKEGKPTTESCNGQVPKAMPIDVPEESINHSPKPHVRTTQYSDDPNVVLVKPLPKQQGEDYASTRKPGSTAAAAPTPSAPTPAVSNAAKTRAMVATSAYNWAVDNYITLRDKAQTMDVKEQANTVTCKLDPDTCPPKTSNLQQAYDARDIALAQMEKAKAIMDLALTAIGQ